MCSLGLIGVTNQGYKRPVAWQVQGLLVYKDSFSWDENVFEGRGEGTLEARAVTILSWWGS